MPDKIIPVGRNDRFSRIYTPFSELKREIRERYNNKQLLSKVREFFGPCMLDVMNREPQVVLSRSIVTPNMELSHFLNLTAALGIPPLFLEYPDKFVAKNMDKYHLCKLYFYRNTNDGTSKLVNTLRIINFNEEEGKLFKDITTTWGENIIDTHHRMLFMEHQHLRNRIYDFSEWFNEKRYLGKFYYLYFLSLFICNGVLLENFLFEDKEEGKFITEKFLPSFEEVERIFGVKPLIYPLLPFKSVNDAYWQSYPENSKPYWSGKYAQKVL